MCVSDYFITLPFFWTFRHASVRYFHTWHFGMFQSVISILHGWESMGMGRFVHLKYVWVPLPREMWFTQTRGSSAVLGPGDPLRGKSVPPLGGSRRNIAMPFGVEKLEWCGYPTVTKRLCVFGGRGLCVFGGLCVDMWRLVVHQWSFLLFWLSLIDCFWRLVHCWYQSSNTVCHVISRT